MKSTSEKQKFIELRAKGLSFDKIAQELGISKPTLLKWSQDYKKEIANLLYFQFESTLTLFRLEKNSRIESMAMILSKAMEELKSRSFEEFSGRELLSIIDHANEKLRGEFSSVRYVTDKYEDSICNIQDEILAPKTLPFPY
ncbi:MAG TPA: helix-turn-helix domain-containing protein [Chlamydiales bacterium]|jgi:transcriptional regulator with XRE-family HTH domain|nr:helix-turn-helix domain-containing protein [Chlamydiales bacterium]